MNTTDAPHTLLPEYKATNSSRYHINQRVITDQGIRIWREIATFSDSARRDEVLHACNNHATLVAVLENILASYDANDTRGIAEEIERSRATLSGAKGGTP